MSKLKGLRHLLQSFLASGRADRDSADEIAFHIECQTQKHIEAGMPPAAARTTALREFGGTRQSREEAADARRGRVTDSVIQDVRYGLRAIRRHPGFSSLAILTLAVGLGGAVSAFALGDAILRRPLPYHEPDRLVSIVQANQHSNGFRFSMPNFSDLRGAATSFSSLGAALPQAVVLDLGGSTVELEGAAVTRDWFTTLGIRPFAGRLLMPADADPGATSVVVLGYEVWRQHYGSDPEIIGRQIHLAGGRLTVVGVAPRGFEYPGRSGLWFPCRWCDAPPENSRASMLADVVGRLGEASIAQASAEVAAIAGTISQRHPNFNLNQMRSIRLVPLRTEVIGDAGMRVGILCGAMLVLLAICCANLAGANLARNVSRIRELSVRSALGASRRRVVQQLLVENLMLSSVAAGVGLVLAWWTTALLSRYGAAHFPRLQELRIDGTAVLFACLAAIAVTLLVGLMPALHVSGRELRKGINDAGRSVAAGRSRARTILLGAEIALCLLIVAAAGLAARSLARVYDEPLGVDASGLATLEFRINHRKYRTSAQQLELYEALLAKVQGIPGVTGAAAAATVPLGPGWIGLLEIEGRPDLQRATAAYNLVMDDYFATVGVPLLHGRLLTSSDVAGSDHVTVIDKAMADRFWPGRDPIGQRFKAVSMGRDTPGWLTVVGVVGNVRTFSLENDTNTPMHYVSARQRPAMLGSTTVIARTELNAAAIGPDLQRALAAVDPEFVAITSTIDALIEKTTTERRQVMLVLAAFAAIALLLSGIGIYGVLSYEVALRTREIGIRLALGSSRSRVLRNVLRHLALPVVLGLSVGLFAALASSQVFQLLVYRVSPADPAALGLACAMILLLCALATSIPARRALQVDPMISLRTD